MAQLSGSCIFGQSGGPTSVINSSAAGVIQEALKYSCITNVYGAAHGIKGILEENLYDLSKEDPKEIELLKITPSSILGSVRHKLKSIEDDEESYKRILEVFKKYKIRYFFYNGGNDSMDTCNKVSKYLQKVGYECRIIGIPKTIDNDLLGTDHCPGFGSAAKYITTSTMEIFHDARVYDKGTITILEIMGRNAGWLTASSALATQRGYGPDLIYLPETPFSIEKFLEETNKVYKENKYAIVAVSEGAKDKNGKYIVEMCSAHSQDSFGHTQLGGAASILSSLVKEKITSKCRGIEFSLLQRCASHVASLTDVNEAYMAGQAAVRYAIDGKTDYMVGFKREAGSDYKCSTILVNLSDAANSEKKIPTEWINSSGNGLNDEFIKYATPLIQGESSPPYENGLPRFAKLKKISATR